MKKILIHLDRPNPRYGYFPWLLHDPLILSEAGIKPEVKIVPQWMDHLIQWMIMQLDWITRTGAKRINDVRLTEELVLVVGYIFL